MGNRFGAPLKMGSATQSLWAYSQQAATDDGRRHTDHNTTEFIKIHQTQILEFQINFYIKGKKPTKLVLQKSTS